MADFERKLLALAERGTRVGPVEMIERVEAALADDPVVVVELKGKDRDMSSTTRSETSFRRRRPLLVGLALFGGILALALAFSFGTREDVAEVAGVGEPSDLALIESYMAAWYGGDADTALDILDFDAADAPNIVDFVGYEAEIGARVVATCEAASSADIYNCDIEYSNELMDVVGAPPQVGEWSARITGENIEVLAADRIDGINGAWWRYQLAESLDAQSPCDRSVPLTADCARFQLEHAERFASWYARNG